MADFGKRSRQDWDKLATRENKGKQADSLTWQTPEGIPVRPLYTAEDAERALKLFKTDQPKTYLGRYMHARDQAFLNRAIEVLQLSKR